jgi:hypothetical protein
MKSPRTVVPLAALLSVVAFVDSATAEDKSSEPKLKIIVPMYLYPEPAALKHWDALIAAADKAPIVAIINPASGPGKSADPNYVEILKKAKSSKLTLVGYVSTSYAKIPLRDVTADIDTWQRLYPGLHGFFFDEQSSGPDQVAHYEAIAQHARQAIPKALLIANPGTVCDEKYFQKNTADIWCTFEAGDKPDAYQPPAWAKKYPAKQFYLLSYGVKDASAVSAALKSVVDKHVGAVFITDGVLPNPWDRVPPYWDALVKEVGNINRGKKP